MIRVLMVLALLGALAACNHNLADYGHSYEANQKAQAMYEEPVSSEESPVFDGSKAGSVIESYRRADERIEDRRLLRDLGN